MSIFQRIGEAIASQGKITLVAALTPDEGIVLTNSGFKKVGTMDIEGSLVDLYEVKVTQVINTTLPYNGIRSPSDNKIFPFGETPKKYEAQWPENYRLYTYGTGTPPDVQYRGSTTSLMDAACNPLSILEDYFFPTGEYKNRSTLKIDLGDMPLDEQFKVLDTVKKEFHERKADYTDDSWTSYNAKYTGNSDFRNW